MCDCQLWINEWSVRASDQSRNAFVRISRWNRVASVLCTKVTMEMCQMCPGRGEWGGERGRGKDNVIDVMTYVIRAYLSTCQLWLVTACCDAKTETLGTSVGIALLQVEWVGFTLWTLRSLHVALHTQQLCMSSQPSLATCFETKMLKITTYNLLWNNTVTYSIFSINNHICFNFYILFLEQKWSTCSHQTHSWALNNTSC